MFGETEYLGSFLFTCPEECPSSWKEGERAQALAQQAALLLQMARWSEQERLSAVREERNRLACEVHDALAQHFAGISLQLGVAQRLAQQQPEEAWKLVRQAADLARTAVEEARRSVWALHPTAAEYSNLASRLPLTVAQMTSGTPVQGEVQVYGTPRLLPSDIGLNLLRICQEAVSNVLHHARASYLFIELTFDTAQVRLCIQDNGQGFDLQKQEAGGGFGLIGMRQRAERIGGHFTISSQLGHGSEVAVTVAIPITLGP